MNRRSLVPASLIALLLAASVGAAEPVPPTVATTGTATVYVAPDRVDIRFTIQTFDADLKRAKAANDLAATGTLQYFRTQNVPEASIRSDFARTEPVYDQTFDNGRPVRGPLKGYQVTRSYGVRLDDLTKFGEVIDHLLSDPAISVDGHAFSAKEDRKYRDEARRKAIRAAKEKAELLAGELGAKVGFPQEIQEQNVGPIVPMYRASNFLGAAGDAGPASELAPVGQIEIKAEIAVRFLLEGKP